MSLQDFNAVVDASRLEADDKQRIKRLMALLSKSSRLMNAFELRAAREAAGLSLSQAAKLVRLQVRELGWCEEGDWEPMAEASPLSDAFDATYGLGKE